jgi:hypothetical protein
MLYVIIVDGDGFDQVCETAEDAKREKRDLERLGCTVKIKKVADWKAADDLEDKMRAR